MAATKSATVKEVTEDYLSSLDLQNLPSDDVMEYELLLRTAAVFELENASLPKGMKWRLPQSLFPYQIARILSYCGYVVQIAAAGLQQDPSYDLLGVYMFDGPEEGTYQTQGQVLTGRIQAFNSVISDRELAEVERNLRVMTKRVTRTELPNLVAMNNGIFDYDTKQLLPFSPEYVFTSKSHVDYNPNAINSVIHNSDDGTDWDVESWMNELSDDPEVVQLLWEVVGSILRPNNHWDKSVWFYSEVGNNGKGTLCALMRNLLGEHAYASIPLSDFAKDFMLEPIVAANAIIVDENDVGVFVDKAANLKAIITGDMIQINRKFKAPIAYRFHGVMIQCLNEMPRIKDKSDSFYRRQLFVPFEKSFTGRERKYIKHDYLCRSDVLEYVAYKVLNMDYTKFSEPAACQDALGYYKDYNDPVRQFVDEIVPLCVWDLVPYPYLYALYRSWFTKNAPSGQPVSRNTFVHDVGILLRDDDEWYVMSSKENAQRASGRMALPEPLTIEYGLKDWMNPVYTGLDSKKLAVPPSDGRYRGLVRKSSLSALEEDTNVSDEESD